MSNSHALKATILVVSALLALNGCGDGGDDPAVPQTVSPPSGATGENAPDTETPANPDDPGAGDEEGAAVDAEIRLSDGGFAQESMQGVHVPAYFTVDLALVASDDAGYTVAISSPDGAQSVRLPKKGEKRLTFDGGLRPDESITLKTGGKTVRVTADAEPGP